MRLVLATLFASLYSIAPMLAVTVAPLEFEQLVKQSAAVVLARVVDVRGESIEGGRGIESVITVSVLRELKGSAAAGSKDPAPRTGTLQFTVPGGRVGRYLNLIPGAPTFNAGDVAVIFLTSRGARLPVTTGLTQGVYRVQSSGGQLMVMPPIVDTGKVSRGDLQRKPVSLAAFEASVRSVLAPR